MIDENEIRRWIARLETEESSWGNYAKLATLYTVMRNQNGAETSATQHNSRPVAMYSGGYVGSEFLQAVSAAPAEKAWKVMDDLMDTLSAVNPRVYASVMRKIDALHEE